VTLFVLVHLAEHGTRHHLKREIIHHGADNLRRPSSSFPPPLQPPGNTATIVLPIVIIVNGDNVNVRVIQIAMAFVVLAISRTAFSSSLPATT
jgi:hypothetical protein